MMICEGKRGTKLTVYDDGSCRSSQDDWTEVTVTTNFRGCVDVSTFENTRFYSNSDYSNAVYAFYRTSGNLDGKISCMTFEL